MQCVNLRRVLGLHSGVAHWGSGSCTPYWSTSRASIPTEAHAVARRVLQPWLMQITHWCVYWGRSQYWCWINRMWRYGICNLQVCVCVCMCVCVCVQTWCLAAPIKQKQMSTNIKTESHGKRIIEKKTPPTFQGATYHHPKYAVTRIIRQRMS